MGCGTRAAYNAGCRCAECAEANNAYFRGRYASRDDGDGGLRLPVGTAPGPWRDQAACAGADVNLFFPEFGEAPKEALAYCARCPVREDCREHAIVNKESGVWGGTSDRQRRRLRAKRAAGMVECSWCRELFKPKATEGCCSEGCRTLHRRRYLREHKRLYRDVVTFEKLDGGHGTISRYNGGCRCAACRAVSREKRAEYRRRAAS